MDARQTSIPRQWFVADTRVGEALWPTVRRLPRGSGILFLYRDLSRRDRARVGAKLRRLARTRGLIVADEAAGEAVRVHDLRELRRAGLARAPLIFLSPMNPTRSHPEWKPMRRMTASRMARLSCAPVIALGGMDERTFRRIERLGFSGWGGIDAYVP